MVIVIKESMLHMDVALKCGSSTIERCKAFLAENYASIGSPSKGRKCPEI